MSMQFDVWFTLFVAVVALMAAGGGVLLLVGYLDSVPMSIAAGWRWAAVAILIPIAGPIYFCYQHWHDCRKTGLQLIAGAVIVLVAGALLYGFGPWFAARAMAPLPPA